MAGTQPYRIKTISEYHQLMGLPKPEHPLISVIHYEDMKKSLADKSGSVVFDFYSISLKRISNSQVKYRYGQQAYDFDEGILFFIAPGQLFGVQSHGDYKLVGWMILVHPDFFWNTSLAKKMTHYEFFNYAVHEALHLSEKEELNLTAISKNVEQEYHGTIDKFSQDVIIAQLELLFTYSERFYERQFLTRKMANHEILARLEEILADCFDSDELIKKGIPTVQTVADTLNLSPGYLSRMLTLLTGQSTQQHIHDKLIEKAKEQLSTTSLSVSEIAYALGFEHPQSFSKLFKTKNNLSPLDFRQSFN